MTQWQHANALQKMDEQPWHPPLGFIFGAFMLSMMIGSSLFKRQTELGWPVTKVLRFALIAAAGSMAVAAMTVNPSVLLVAFVVYEAACGVFYPAMGSLRGKILPEANRAAIIGWFRVPLNFIVVIFLLMIRTATHKHLFAGCFILCLCSVFAHSKVTQILGQELAQETKAPTSVTVPAKVVVTT